jgi:uncharacterized protein YcbK (DUF882 family)
VQLSPHFALEEFLTHGAPRPARSVISEYTKLCHVYLEPLRAMYGRTIVHSGIRTAEHNRAVGGAPASMHVVAKGRPGVAADVSCVRGDAEDWFHLLRQLSPGGLGLYPSHVHVDTRRGFARW